jgi:hypothetical protein
MTKRQAPKIEDAPGIVWRARKAGWVATWQARSDLIKAGFIPQTVRLWEGEEPTEAEAQAIAKQCRRMQSEMLTFSRAGDFVTEHPTKTLRDLCNKYQTDPTSTHGKKRYHTRRNHDLHLKRIVDAHGDELLSAIRARQLLLWHDEWSDGGNKVAMGHMMMSMLRTMFGFGATMLENAECERLSGVMHHMRFEMGKPREEVLTAEQATAHRAKAREVGWYSMALAQAFQFDLMLRQKDVIGEWVPMSEPGVSDYTAAKGKWLRGLRWSEIDANMVLRHTTSKKEKPLVVDLKLAPMVQEELQHIIEMEGELPKTGPIVICEASGIPWSASEYRRKWRIIADMVKIPKEVRNQDSRAGAISEATEAGADLEHVRHAATHSDISMTQRYSRKSEEKVANVQKLRLEHRNKTKT